MSERFPWVELFRIGLHKGLGPDALWRMTPANAFALLLPDAQLNEDAVMSRARFEALARAFPDHNQN